MLAFNENKICLCVESDSVVPKCSRWVVRPAVLSCTRLVEGGETQSPIRGYPISLLVVLS